MIKYSITTNESTKAIIKTIYVISVANEENWKQLKQIIGDVFSFKKRFIF